MEERATDLSSSDRSAVSTVVSCRSVSKVYRQGEVAVYALSNVDFDIAAGEFTSLCGPSGSGKTTLLNLIGGLDSPSGGEICVCGKRFDLLSRAELSRVRLNRLGFVFQAYNLIPVLSAQENVEFVMQLQGVAPKQRSERARKVLSAVGLSGMENRRPAELSGGQQQRVAVARAIANEPEIVLADEPTANLDSKTAESLIELMLDLNQRLGMTFLFSTHDQLVMDYARRLVRLKDGQIESDQLR